MAVWCGKTSNCWWFYHHGALEGWDDYVSAMATAIADALPGDVLLTVPYRADPPDARRRKLLADAVGIGSGEHPITHHAFVTDSTVAYGVFVAVTWMIKRPWVDKAFRAPDEAFGWLTRSSPRFDAGVVRRGIAARIEPAAAWPAFFGREVGARV